MNHITIINLLDLSLAMMVILSGNKCGNSSSNPEWSYLRFNSQLWFWEIFFRGFGISNFNIYCLILLAFLLSPVPSDLFPWVVFFFFNCCIAFLFSSQHIPAFFLCLITFAFGHRFLVCISSLISHPGFKFMILFFWPTPILAQTNFALHRLFRLIPWFRSLRYVFIIRLFFRFLSWFLLDGNIFFSYISF